MAIDKNRRAARALNNKTEQNVLEIEKSITRLLIFPSIFFAMGFTTFLTKNSTIKYILIV